MLQQTRVETVIGAHTRANHTTPYSTGTASRSMSPPSLDFHPSLASFVPPLPSLSPSDYHLKWMQEFPTITVAPSSSTTQHHTAPRTHHTDSRPSSLQALSEASIDDINRVWAGLGYYRRAKLLQQGAIKVHPLYLRPFTLSTCVPSPSLLASLHHRRSCPLLSPCVSSVCGYFLLS
jgi:hypothetical protein